MADTKRKPTVVIPTNDQQMVAALVSAYSLKSRSKSPELFDVRILRLEETPHLYKRDHQKLVWWDARQPSVWRRRDLQSFAPLRRMVPELLGFAGRALVIDPDVFAVGDVMELLSRNMDDKAIVCCRKPEWRAGRQLYSSAVMLLDCGKLTHWDWKSDIDDLFSQRLGLGPWLSLLDMAEEDVGLLEQEWNHTDILTLRQSFCTIRRLRHSPGKLAYAPITESMHRGVQRRWSGLDTDPFSFFRRGRLDRSFTCHTRTLAKSFLSLLC